MNSKAILSGGIGLVLVIIMIILVVWLKPMREFPGWQILLPIVLIVVVGGMFALRAGGGRGTPKS